MGMKRVFEMLDVIKWKVIDFGFFFFFLILTSFTLFGAEVMDSMYLSSIHPFSSRFFAARN